MFYPDSLSRPALRPGTSNSVSLQRPTQIPAQEDLSLHQLYLNDTLNATESHVDEHINSSSAEKRSTDDDSRLKLTDLPRELQEMILKNLLVVPSEPFDPFAQPKPPVEFYPGRLLDFDMQKQQTGLFKFNENVLRKRQMGRIYPDILLVNKSLHEIGTPLLMENQMFTVTSLFDLAWLCDTCRPRIKFWTIQPHQEEHVRPVLSFNCNISPNSNPATLQRLMSKPVLMFDCRDLSTVLFLLQGQLQEGHCRAGSVMVTVDEARCKPDSTCLQLLTWHCKTTFPGYMEDVVLVGRCVLRPGADIEPAQSPSSAMVGWVAELRENLQASSAWCTGRGVPFDFRPAANFIIEFLSKLDAFVQQGYWPDCEPDTNTNNPFAESFEIEAANAYRLWISVVIAANIPPHGHMRPHFHVATGLLPFWQDAGYRMNYLLGVLGFRGAERMPPTFGNLGNFDTKDFVEAAHEHLSSSQIRELGRNVPARAHQNAHVSFCQAAVLMKAMPDGGAAGDMDKPWYDRKRQELRALESEWMGQNLGEQAYREGRARWERDGQWRLDFYRSLEPWWEQIKFEKWGHVVTPPLRLGFN